MMDNSQGLCDLRFVKINICLNLQILTTSMKALVTSELFVTSEYGLNSSLSYIRVTGPSGPRSKSYGDT